MVIIKQVCNEKEQAGQKERPTVEFREEKEYHGRELQLMPVWS